MTTTAAQMVAAANAALEAVTPQQAFDELNRGDAVILDVREPIEWEHFVEGAVQVPRGTLEFSADPTSSRHHPSLDPGRRVIVYCRSGARAALAGATLKALGFTDVANMTGGFAAWQQAGLPAAEFHAGL